MPRRFVRPHCSGRTGDHEAECIPGKPETSTGPGCVGREYQKLSENGRLLKTKDVDTVKVEDVPSNAGLENHAGCRTHTPMSLPAIGRMVSSFRATWQL